MTEIERAWARITRWCEQHAPVTAGALHPPAGTADVARAEAATVGPWPDELRAWFAVQNGAEPVEGDVLLDHAPIDLDELVEWWQTWQEVRAEQPEDVEEDGTAGGATSSFPAALLPISNDSAGNCYAVDLRPGPMRGCVTLVDHEESFVVDGDLAVWPSLAAMLTEVADGLEQGRAVRGVVPVVEDGELAWHDADADADDAPRGGLVARLAERLRRPRVEAVPRRARP